MRPALSLTPPRCPRYESLDIWRGFACLLVVIFHSAYYSIDECSWHHGSGTASAVIGCISRFWMGVPIFFVISGYCISATADSTRRRPHSFRTYFYRRFRRIFPPFWIFLLLSVLLVGASEFAVKPGLFADSAHAIPRPWSLSAAQWFGNVSLTETWRPHVLGGPSDFFMGHAWTLCYEEQFYAVTGLLLLISGARFFHLAAAVSALVLVPTLCRAFGVRIHCVEGFFFDGRWLEFAAGVLLYYCLNYGGAAVRKGTVFCLLGAVALCCASHKASHLRFDFATEMLVACLFAIAALACRPWDELLRSARILWPLKMCGRMCYSLYLVHWPVSKAISHLLFGLFFTFADEVAVIPDGV
jgi:peptidoglycan/LPS O-acetylase OafA/YrhL